MPLATYKEKAQSLFRIDKNPEDERKEHQESHIAPRRGFTDITEIQTETIRGVDQEFVLTSHYSPPPREKSKKTDREYDSYALLVRRVVQRLGKLHIPIRNELCIQSENLCDAFREVVGTTYDGVDIQITPITLIEPFFELFFKRKEIHDYASNKEKPEDTRKEMGLLDDFIRNKDKTTKDIINEYNALVPKGKVNIRILWTIFPPNELLVVNDGRVQEFWICRNIMFKSKHSIWTVRGVRLDYDGKTIGMTEQGCEISFRGAAGGTLGIGQLPILPFRYLPVEEQRKSRDKLLKRGKMFRDIMNKDLNGFAYREYNGLRWSRSGIHNTASSEVGIPCSDVFIEILTLISDA